jgi:alpha-galactosidase
MKNQAILILDQPSKPRSVSPTKKSVAIAIETNDYALVLATDEDNRLRMTHFGKRLKYVPDYAHILPQFLEDTIHEGIYNAAYTTSGSTNILEPALTITHADGNLSTELKYIKHKVINPDKNIRLTTILLKDEIYALEVALHFQVFLKENVIEQWAVITNKEKKAIELKKYASCNLYFSANEYYLTSYHSAWAKEFQPEEVRLTDGIKTIESKLGTRPNLFASPSFQLAFDRPATEDEGKVLLGQLTWTGNFKLDFEMDAYRNLRFIGGINPYSSEYPLATNQSFTTPSFVFTYSENGKGEASRNLHRWARKYRIMDADGTRMTLLNNWEATYFDFDEQKLVKLLDTTKEAGLDLFLLDDGWFANKYPRNSDTTGLGDWQENKEKLPNGLGYLVQKATERGVKFGVWIEPEMVNPKSELYENHPDWVLKQPNRPEFYCRNQLVLDLTNPSVQDFVFGILDGLFTKNPDLAFIKWDCNSQIYNGYSHYLASTKQRQSQLYVDYVKGFYSVVQRVRAKYPSVHIMLCSAGGCRADYEVLKYFTEFWISDNTNAMDRIFQQWEYSYFYPAIVCCHHVTDWNKVPIKFRTDVAMMGKLGFDIIIDALSPNDKASVKKAINDYNGIKNLVWHGDLYRLVNPWQQRIASLMYVNDAKDKAVQFTYLTSNRFDVRYTPSPIKLKGLDATKKYKIRELNLYPNTQTTLNESAVYSGDFLMSVGFNPDISTERASVVLEIIVV